LAASAADIKVPVTESLQDTIDRTIPLWDSHILPDLRAGRNVLVMAHRNSIRGIIKHIDNISPAEIHKVNANIRLFFIILNAHYSVECPILFSTGVGAQRHSACLQVRSSDNETNSTK
jgi:bisphosphoglycerate-dependent phosphoglycerate mutase